MPIKSSDHFNKFAFIANKNAPLGRTMAEGIGRSREAMRLQADQADAGVARRGSNARICDVYHTQETRCAKRLEKLAANVPKQLHADNGEEFSLKYKSIGPGQYQVRAQPKMGTPPPVDSSVLELGTLLVGDARFEPGTSAQNGRKIFTRIGDVPGSAVQFVQDSKGQMIRRYQVRYINAHDLRAFNDDESMTSKLSSKVRAKHITAPTKKESAAFGYSKGLSEEKQIIAHTTWGDQRFVSLSSTARPILGSGGKNFDGETGYVVVDMTHIHQSETVSLHSSPTLANLVRTQTVDELYVGDDEPRISDDADTEDKARATIKADAIRTKEVLVREIPPEAIVAGRSKEGDIEPDRFADKDLRALFAKLPSNHY